MPALSLKRQGFYADLALVTDKGDVRIVGEGFDLPSGIEVFFLNLVEFSAETYWKDKAGNPAWPPSATQLWSAVDLFLTFKQRGMGSLLSGPRQVRFYRNASDLFSGLPPCGVLQSAAAVSLSGEACGPCQLLIYATPELACSLEVVLERARIESILAELEEFDLS